MANEDQTQPRSYELDLELITGSPVVRIVGRVANEFGEPSFKLMRVITAAGDSYDVEGEHDFPYLCGLDEQRLAEHYKR